MEDVMLEVAEKCAEELGKYTACVGLNPSDWDVKCEKERISVQDCSSTKVPFLDFLHQECGKEIQDFESCLQSEEESETKCIQQYEILNRCTSFAQADPRNPSPMRTPGSSN